MNLRYRCDPDILWLRDADTTHVIHPPSGRRWALTAAGAALWDCLVLGYPEKKTIRLFAALAGGTEEAAIAEMNGLLERWHGEGILVADGEAHP